MRFARVPTTASFMLFSARRFRASVLNGGSFLNRTLEVGHQVL